MTGAELQEGIADMARVLGWRVAHFRPARTKHGWRTAGAYDAKGYPDLTLVRDRVIFAEVKGDGDTISDDQQAWIDALVDAGAVVYVWRPLDWTSGGIERILLRSDPPGGRAIVAR